MTAINAVNYFHKRLHHRGFQGTKYTSANRQKKITDQTDLSKLYPTIHLTFTKRYISVTLEFQIEGEGGIDGETGIFQPRQ